VISRALSSLIVKVKGVFSFQQGLCWHKIRLIADSCQHLKKLILYGVRGIDDDDIIHVIDRLGNQLTTLVLFGEGLTDVAYSYLNKCVR
jgi:hypothetical protein